MKTKYIILLAITAIATLSFTFVSKSTAPTTEQVQLVESSSAPVGGQVAHDNF
jgi:hypothetical protein